MIQAVALAELDGLETPNSYGHRPLVGQDPGTPDIRPGPRDDYWDHVDFVIRRAAEKGLFIGLLPNWRDKVWKATWGKGPEVFTVDNARVYGRFIGGRYRNQRNLLWILGGDRPPVTADRDYRDLWRSMAAGIKEAGGSQLMTYHPGGGTSTSQHLHSESWLDFNMFQSGHGARDIANDDFDSRPAAYWGVFAGAVGHTCGCHDIWQFWQPGRDPISSARTPWKTAVELPAFQPAGNVGRGNDWVLVLDDVAAGFPLPGVVS